MILDLNGDIEPAYRSARSIPNLRADVFSITLTPVTPLLSNVSSIVERVSRSFHSVVASPMGLSQSTSFAPHAPVVYYYSSRSMSSLILFLRPPSPNISHFQSIRSTHRRYRAPGSYCPSSTPTVTKPSLQAAQGDNRNMFHKTFMSP